MDTSWVSDWLKGNTADNNTDEDKTVAGDSSSQGTSSSANPSRPSLAEAEAIRQKRLQLYERNTTPTTTTPCAVNPSLLSTQNNDTNPCPVSRSVSSDAPLPLSPSSVLPPLLPPSASPQSSPPRKQPRAVIVRDVVSDTLKRILCITLTRPDVASYTWVDPSLLTVPTTRTLTCENVDEILFARLTSRTSSSTTPSTTTTNTTMLEVSTLDYLIQVFARSESEAHSLQVKQAADNNTSSPPPPHPLLEAVTALRDSCIHYAVTSICEPELFASTSEHALNALDATIKTQTMPLVFLTHFVTALQSSEPRVCVTTFTSLFRRYIGALVSLDTRDSILGDFVEPLCCVTYCLKVKPVARLFIDMTGFDLVPAAPKNGAMLQQASALGICLSFCTDAARADPVVTRMFENVTHKSQVEVDGSLTTLRGKLNLLQDLVHQLLLSLLKAGPVPKEAVLMWFHHLLHYNTERAKDQPSRALISTSGMFHNAVVMLLRLASPFLTPTSTKVTLIQPSYLMTSKSLFPDETLLCRRDSDENEDENAREHRDVVSLTPSHDMSETTETTELPIPVHFITDVFFTTWRGLHLGPVSDMREYTKLNRHLGHLQHEMEGHNAGNRNPTSIQSRRQAQFDALLAKRFRMEAALMHSLFITDVLSFCLLACRFLASVVTQCPLESGPAHNLVLPVPLPPLGSVAANRLAHLPEHFVDNVTQVFIFYGRFRPSVLGSHALEPLMTLCCVLLASPALISSPHLRAKLSTVVFSIFCPLETTSTRASSSTSSSRSRASEVLMTHPLAQQYLAPALLALYGDVEATGFYEKLEHRYQIACVLKHLWSMASHREAFVLISQNTETFIKFAHGLMNHINSLVTDALSSLPEIKRLMEERHGWSNLSSTDRQAKESLLDEKERTVTSSLQLANETIHMMSYLTTEITQPFLCDQLRDRLASMLNNVLVKLVGPKGLELKVTNPAQYHFQPTVMLKDIVETLLHFAPSSSFQATVAANGFYLHDVYLKGVSICRRIQLLSPTQLVALETFMMDVKGHFEALAFEEWDDIPDEFVDPILATLMTDPVRLPSGYVVDAATIATHLLNDLTCPFTREPLTPDQVVPCDALKNTIAAWVAEKKKGRRAPMASTTTTTT